MDVFEFVAKLTESLAWPVVAIVAIAIFRRDAKAGIDRLRKLDAFGVSAEFELARLEMAVDQAASQVPADVGPSVEPPAAGSDDRLDEGTPAPGPASEPGPRGGARPTSQATPAPNPGQVPEDGRRPVLFDIPDEPVLPSPSAIVLAEWGMLERHLRATYMAQPIFSLRDDRVPNLKAILNGLATIGALSQGQRDAILYARDLRNKIAHGVHAPTVEEASRYAQAAQSLRSILSRAAH